MKNDEIEVGQKVKVPRTGDLGEVVGVNDDGVILKWEQSEEGDTATVVVWETWEKLLSTGGVEIVEDTEDGANDLINRVLSGEDPKDVVDSLNRR
jgi:hypothetical protein